jgi:hypothetical protein
MAIILRPSFAGGKRAEYITAEDAEALVQAGDAVKCAGYGEIYEEPSAGEREQGYMTRDMTALSRAPKKRASASKSRDDSDTPPEAA